MKKLRGIIIGGFSLSLVIGLLYPFGILLIEYSQARANAEYLRAMPGLETEGTDLEQGPGEPGQVDVDRSSGALVVYFSRSGNTELVAHQIARLTEATIIALESEEYALGTDGMINAWQDAGNHFAKIRPARIDLTSYKIIFICSPIWWYRPAPPAWAFVDGHEFTDQQIVLVNTYNSRFEQQNIDAFQALVERQGGRFVKHIPIKRDRMPFQISADEMLSRVQEALARLPVVRE